MTDRPQNECLDVDTIRQQRDQLVEALNNIDMVAMTTGSLGTIKDLARAAIAKAEGR